MDRTSVEVEANIAPRIDETALDSMTSSLKKMEEMFIRNFAPEITPIINELRLRETQKPLQNLQKQLQSASRNSESLAKSIDEVGEAFARSYERFNSGAAFAKVWGANWSKNISAVSHQIGQMQMALVGASGTYSRDKEAEIKAAFQSSRFYRTASGKQAGMFFQTREGGHGADYDLVRFGEGRRQVLGAEFKQLYGGSDGSLILRSGDQKTQKAVKLSSTSERTNLNKLITYGKMQALGVGISDYSSQSIGGSLIGDEAFVKNVLMGKLFSSESSSRTSQIGTILNWGKDTKSKGAFQKALEEKGGFGDLATQTLKNAGLLNNTGFSKQAKESLEKIDIALKKTLSSKFTRLDESFSGVFAENLNNQSLKPADVKNILGFAKSQYDLLTVAGRDSSSTEYNDLKKLFGKRVEEVNSEGRKFAVSGIDFSSINQDTAKLLMHIRSISDDKIQLDKLIAAGLKTMIEDTDDGVNKIASYSSNMIKELSSIDSKSGQRIKDSLKDSNEMGGVDRLQDVSKSLREELSRTDLPEQTRKQLLLHYGYVTESLGNAAKHADTKLMKEFQELLKSGVSTRNLGSLFNSLTSGLMGSGSTNIIALQRAVAEFRENARIVLRGYKKAVDKIVEPIEQAAEVVSDTVVEPVDVPDIVPQARELGDAAQDAAYSAAQPLRELNEVVDKGQGEARAAGAVLKNNDIKPPEGSVVPAAKKHVREMNKIEDLLEIEQEDLEDALNSLSADQLKSILRTTKVRPATISNMSVSKLRSSVKSEVEARRSKNDSPLLSRQWDSLGSVGIAMMPGQSPIGQEVTRILKKYNLGKLVSHITGNISGIFEPLNRLYRGFASRVESGSLLKAVTSFDKGIGGYIKGLRDRFVKWNAAIPATVESFDYMRNGKQKTGYRMTDVTDVNNARMRGSVDSGPDLYTSRQGRGNLAPKFINFETYQAEMLRRTLANEDRSRIIREIEKIKTRAPQELGKIVPKLREFFDDVTGKVRDTLITYITDLRKKIIRSADITSSSSGPDSSQASTGAQPPSQSSSTKAPQGRRNLKDTLGGIVGTAKAANDIIKIIAGTSLGIVRENLSKIVQTLTKLSITGLTALQNILQKIAQPLHQLANAIGQFRNQMNQAFSQAASRISQFSSTMIGGLNKVGASLDTIGKKYEGFGKKVKNGFESAKESAATLYFLSSTMTQAGSKLTGFGNRGIQNTKQFLDQYSKYEMAVNRVAVSGQVGSIENPEGGFQQVQDFIFNLQRGEYTRTGADGSRQPISVDMFNAEELAQATYYYQSAAGSVGGGLETRGGQEAMAKILGPIMNMAAATQTNPEEYIKGVVNIAQQFGIDPTKAQNADMMGNIANVVGQIANVTTLEIPDILETFKYVGPQLNMLAGGKSGAGLGDALMLVEMASRAGIKGSMAGTGIGQIMSTFVDVPKAVAESVAPILGMGELKGDSAISAFEGKFLDDKGQLEGGILGAISKIVESTSGEPAEVATTLAKIFTQNATRTSSAIASQIVKAAGSEQFLNAAQAYNEGDFGKANALYEEAMARTSDTVTASVSRVRNAFFQLKVTMFDAVKTPLKDYLNDLANIFFELADAVKSNKGLSQFVAGITSVLTIVATVIGSLLTFGGTLFMIQRSFIMAGGSISLFFGIITTLFSGLFAMIPVILLVGIAVAALIGHFKDSSQSISDFVATIRGDFGEELGNRLQGITTTIKDSLTLVGTAFYEFVNVILMGTTAIKDGVHYFDSFGNAVKGAGTGVSEFNTDIMQLGHVAELLSRLFGEDTAAALIGLFDHVAGRLTGFRGEVSKNVNDITTKIKALKGIGSIAKGIVQAFANNGSIEAPTMEGINNFAEVFGIEDLQGIIQEAAQFIWDFFGTVVAFAEYLDAQLSAIFENIKSQIHTAFADGKKQVDVFGLALTLVNGILAGMSITILALAGIVQYLATKFSQMDESKNAFVTTIESITGLTMSLENLAKTVGVVLGGSIAARLLMAFQPIGKIIVSFAQLGVVIAKTGIYVTAMALRFGLLAAQLLLNIQLIALQAVVWAVATAAQIAAAGIGMIITAIQKQIAHGHKKSAEAAAENAAATAASSAAHMAQVASATSAAVGLALAALGENKLQKATEGATKEALEHNAALALETGATLALAGAQATAAVATEKEKDKTEESDTAAKKSIASTIGQIFAKISLTGVIMGLVGAMALLIAVYALAVVGAILFTAVIIGMLAYTGGLQAAWDGLKSAGYALYAVVLQLVAVGQQVLNWAINFMGLSDSVSGLTGILTQMGTILGYLIGLPLLGIFAGLVAGVAVAVRAFQSLAAFVSANSAILLQIGTILAKTLVSAFKLVVAVVKTVVAVLKSLSPIFMLVAGVGLLVVAAIGKLMNILTAIMPVLSWILQTLGAFVSALTLVVAAILIKKGVTIALTAVEKAYNAVITLGTKILAAYRAQTMLASIANLRASVTTKALAAATGKATLAMRLLGMVVTLNPIGLLITAILGAIVAVLHFTGALGKVTGFLGKLFGFGSSNPFKGVTEGANEATEAFENLANVDVTPAWLGPNAKLEYKLVSNQDPNKAPADVTQRNTSIIGIELGDAVIPVRVDASGQAVRDPKTGKLVYDVPGVQYGSAALELTGLAGSAGSTFTTSVSTATSATGSTYIDLNPETIQSLAETIVLSRGTTGLSQSDIDEAVQYQIGELNEYVKGLKGTFVSLEGLSRDFGLNGANLGAPVLNGLTGQSEFPGGATAAQLRAADFDVGDTVTDPTLRDAPFDYYRGKPVIETSPGLYEYFDENTGAGTGEIAYASSALGKVRQARQRAEQDLLEGGVSQTDSGLFGIPESTSLVSRVMGSGFVSQVFDVMGINTNTLTDAQAATTKVSLAQVKAVRDSVKGTAAEGIMTPVLDAAETEARRIEDLQDERARIEDEYNAAVAAGADGYADSLLGVMSDLDEQIAESGQTLEEFEASVAAATAQQERTTAILSSVIENLKSEMPGFLDYIRIAQDQTRLGINTFAQVLAGNTAAIDKAIENAKDFAYFDSITGEERSRDFTQQDFLLKGMPNPSEDLLASYGGNMEAFLRSDDPMAARWRDNLIYQGIDPYQIIEDTVGRNPYMVDDRVFQAALGVFASSATQDQLDLMDRGFFDTPEVISYMTNQAMLGNVGTEEDPVGLYDYYLSITKSDSEAQAMLQKHYEELPDYLKDVYGDFINGQWVMDLGLMDKAVTSNMFTEVADLAFDASGRIVKATSDVLNGIPVAYETSLGKTIFMTQEQYSKLTDTQKAMIANAGATVLTYVSDMQQKLHEDAGTKAAIAYTTAYGQGLESGFADIDGDGLIDKYVIDEAGVRVKVNLDLFASQFDGLDGLDDNFTQYDFTVGTLFEKQLIDNKNLAILRTLSPDEGMAYLEDLALQFGANSEFAKTLESLKDPTAYQAFMADLAALEVNTDPYRDAIVEGGETAAALISDAMINAALVSSWLAGGKKGPKPTWDPETQTVVYPDPIVAPVPQGDKLHQIINDRRESDAEEAHRRSLKTFTSKGQLTREDRQAEDEARQAEDEARRETFTSKGQLTREDRQADAERLRGLVIRNAARNADRIAQIGLDDAAAELAIEKARQEDLAALASNATAGLFGSDPSAYSHFPIEWYNELAKAAVNEAVKELADPVVAGTESPETPVATPVPTETTSGGSSGTPVPTQPPSGGTPEPTNTDPKPQPSTQEIQRQIDAIRLVGEWIKLGYVSQGLVSEYDRDQSSYLAMNAWLIEQSSAYQATRNVDGSVDDILKSDGGSWNSNNRRDPKNKGYNLDDVAPEYQDDIQRVDTVSGGDVDNKISLNDIYKSIDIAAIMANAGLSAADAQQQAYDVVNALAQAGIIDPNEIKPLQDNIDQQFTDVTTGLQGVIETDLANALLESEAAFTAVKNAADEGNAAASKLSGSAASHQAAAQMWMTVASYISGISSGDTGAGKVWENKASGGSIKSPFTLVGELGRELVSLPMGSRVFSASQTEDILGEAFSPTVNMMATTLDMPNSVQVETEGRGEQGEGGNQIIVNFNGDMNIRDQRDIELLVDEIDRELGRRTQNAKRGMMGTARSVSVD